MTPVLPAPELDHVCDLRVDLAATHELGEGRAGARRIIPIVGGEVVGPRCNGRILPIGADWQTVLRSGVAELDARYAIETTDGAIIEVVNRGLRHAPPETVAAIARGDDVDPASYYMRTAARLETGHPEWDWVNHAMFVGTGGKRGARVEIALYQVR
jgi:hypothetical protein